tara:strand:- start:43 stop:1206 length:1164 start_codon:yes stop_codon:yes gene_type:complete
MEFEKLNFIIQKFFNNTKVISVRRINSGLINRTYVVEHLYNGLKSKFILQRLSNIFESHEVVNTNHRLITDHIEKKLNNISSNFDRKRWEVPNLIRCESNNIFGFPYESDYWRAMVYIDQVFSCEYLEDEIMAYQAGVGLAKFHSLCSDFDCSKLENSISNFHNTRYYIDKYFYTIENCNIKKSDHEIEKRVKDLKKSLSNHFVFVDLLIRSLSKEKIDQKVIHGDPKLSNFLFDIQNKYVVSLIDLDTVATGNLLIDLADCIRSISNLAGEDPSIKENVYFDIKYCMYFLKGYFSSSSEKKSQSFRFLLVYIYLIIFELTIRFLTDFLDSNSYFQIKFETHNLYRAEVQYRLLSSFLIQIPDLSNKLDEIGISSSPTFFSDVQKLV